MNDSAPLSEPQFVRRALIVLVLAAVIAAAMLFFVYTMQILLVIFASGVLAVPIRWLTLKLHAKARLPQPLALAVVAISLLLIVGLIVAPAAPLLAEQAIELWRSLPKAVEQLRSLTERFAWAEPLHQAFADPLAALQEQDLDYGAIAARAGGVFSNTLALLGSSALVFLLALYLAADANMYVQGFLRLFPKHRRARLLQVLDEMGYTLRWWLFGQSISMTLLGITTTLVLWMLGIPLAFFLGILTALMTFIPNLGPLIAGVPTVLLALTQGPGHALGVLVFYVALQNVEGLLITPNIHRRIIALPPVLILSAQVLLSALVGLAGVILAMPLVACGMVLVRRLYIEDVLGDSGEVET